MKFLHLNLFLAIHITTQVISGPVITFFLRDYPTNQQSPAQQSKHHKGIPINNLVKSNGTNGVFATYAGDLDVSDQNGMVQFPLKQTNPVFNFLVTDKITPILYARNTVHHWELEQGTPASYYTIEKKYDTDSRTHYWLTTAATLPDNKVIPIDTIILFAKPEDIFIPEGIVVSDENPNLTLPDIYVKHSFNKAEHAFYVLNIKNFLHQINLEFKKNEAKNASHIVD